MSTTPTDDASAAVKVEFVQYHRPPLKDGLYKIKVEQTIQTNETTAKKVPATTFSAERTFLVAGERFELKPEEIQAVFPPDGSLGEHSNVMPHVILTRSTLPWERSSLESDAPGSRQDAPWLALLLFDDGEEPEPTVLTLGQLQEAADPKVKFPSLELELGQQADDKVTVIDIPRSRLEKILPSLDELAILAHVRQAKGADKNLVGDELAAIICNRLPKHGALSTAHLVSVEGRYRTTQGGDTTTYFFDYQDAAEDESIRLVSLKSWSFACSDPSQSFKGLLKNLNSQYSVAASLRLPPGADADEAEPFLASGLVPLPHALRQGGATVSWYHGPFIPGPNEVEVELPVRAADQLVRYDPRYGMFDVSYAAAWELGRLLALQSKQFSVSLYNWKRENVQRLKQAEQQVLHPHLPGQQESPDEIPVPAEIASWFDDLGVLRGVPFNYLVPDERMLPVESIRFFRIDHQWIDCMEDGAFSIGRVTKSDHKVEQPSDAAAVETGTGLSGFLLRSNVVSGWPGLLVDGFDAGGVRLDSRRTERLSDSVLLCIFAGEVRRVEIHQQPEMLHFGLDLTDEEPPAFVKQLRDTAGAENGPTLTAINWRDETQRVLDVAAFAAEIGRVTGLGQLTSAQFALQMIEGVEKVALLCH